MIDSGRANLADSTTAIEAKKQPPVRTGMNWPLWIGLGADILALAGVVWLMVSGRDMSDSIRDLRTTFWASSGSCNASSPLQAIEQGPTIFYAPQDDRWKDRALLVVGALSDSFNRANIGDPKDMVFPSVPEVRYFAEEQRANACVVAALAGAASNLAFVLRPLTEKGTQSIEVVLPNW